MNPTRKIYLISFIATSIPYGIMMYAFEYYGSINKGHILWQPIISAVIFGLIMSAFFSIMQKRRLKKAGYPKLTKNLLKVKQAKSIETDLTQEQVIDILKDSNDFKKSKIRSLPNSIIIREKMSWFSWGEIITISFDVKEHKTINIESKPYMPTTLIDYGVNIENVDNVIKLIKAAQDKKHSEFV